MIHDSLFVQNDILESAMQGVIKRNEVIQNNIANVDVPNFKKSTVQFEDELSRVIESAKKTGTLDLTKAKPRTLKLNTNLSQRIDNNNVDIEAEMVDLYQNSMKYEVLVNGVLNNYKKITLVLSSR